MLDNLLYDTQKRDILLWFVWLLSCSHPHFPFPGLLPLHTGEQNEWVVVVDASGALHRPLYRDKAPNASFYECFRSKSQGFPLLSMARALKRHLHQEMPEKLGPPRRGRAAYSWLFWNYKRFLPFKAWQVCGRIFQSSLWALDEPYLCRASFLILLPSPLYRFHLRALPQKVTCMRIIISGSAPRKPTARKGKENALWICCR